MKTTAVFLVAVLAFAVFAASGNHDQRTFKASPPSRPSNVMIHSQLAVPHGAPIACSSLRCIIYTVQIYCISAQQSQLMQLCKQRHHHRPPCKSGYTLPAALLCSLRQLPSDQPLQLYCHVDRRADRPHGCSADRGSALVRSSRHSPVPLDGCTTWHGQHSHHDCKSHSAGLLLLLQMPSL